MSMISASRALASCAGALVFLSAAGAPALADYTGYGNGDPGNWSYFTEQQGGPCAGVRIKKGRTPACCLRYTPEGACPYLNRNEGTGAPPPKA